MPLKIAAGIIFFNDCSSLHRCLNSITEGVDIVFAIDGKFPNFPADSELSTDGSRELVSSFSKCVLIDFPRSEVDKRSKYLEYCALYSIDVLLIIDSDEFVRNPGNWSAFHHNLELIIFGRDKCKYNVYAINLQSLDKSEEVLAYPRVWYCPAEMEYYCNRHFYFRNKNPMKVVVPHQGNHSVNIIEGIELSHDHSLRNESHQKSRFVYQIWLQNYEQSLPFYRN